LEITKINKKTLNPMYLKQQKQKVTAAHHEKLVGIMKEPTRSEKKRGSHHQFYLIQNHKTVMFLDG